MRKFELFVGLTAIVTILYRIFFWSELNMLIVLSLSALTTFYMYFSFAFFNGLELKNIFKKETYKDLSTKRIIGTIGLGLALAITTIGILFDMMLWPGASVNLIAGILCSTIVGLIGLIKYLKNKSAFYLRIFKRIAILAGFGLLFWFIPKETQVKFLYRDHPDYIEAYLNVMNDPSNEALWKIEVDERKKMNNK